MKKIMALLAVALVACMTVFASPVGMPYGIGDMGLEELIEAGYAFQQVDETHFTVEAPWDYDYNLVDDESVLTWMPSVDGMDWVSLTLYSPAEDDDEAALRFLLANAFLTGAYGNPVDEEEMDEWMAYGLEYPLDYESAATFEDVYAVVLAEMIREVFSNDYDFDYPETYQLFMTDEVMAMTDYAPGEGVAITWLDLVAVGEYALSFMQ